MNKETQMTETLSTQFDPSAVEPRWAARWRNEPFVADASSEKPPFAVMIPPPNVTGSLHLGHALDNTLIDVLTRFKRMRGFETLYLPGTDHAGIATQMMVERRLKEQGKNRHDLGREAFLQEVWRWKEESGGQILGQLTRLGVSADWSRERFTLDEGLSKAVRRQFVELYHRGLVYRGERMVNWDPVSQTTLSDLEISREERGGKMYTLRYELERPTADREALEVATVRPETIFADQAVAVHPDDERYKAFIGQRVRVPLTDRYVPIIADEVVEIEFGTGALKITPAHDPTDFEVGERHGLARPSVIDLSGNLSGDLVPEAFRGSERFAARKAVVAVLRENGDLLEEKDHRVAIGLSERTSAPVEPLISEQWFVRTEPLAKEVLAGLNKGEMKLTPARHEKINRDWLENIRDWNISRQLWWGHQIPAWYDDEGNIYVPSLENPDLDPDQDPQYAHLNLRRDPDVFDTWFSSNLWPFSTLGWPEKTPDFEKFYPNSVLVTGYDILFFWVARMQMAAYAHTGKAPFADIVLHGLYLDSKGQKMSKSKGNGIDPLDLFDQYGVDAARFAFAFLSTGGQDIRHDDRRFEQGRNFANKLWNATRFAMMRMEAAGFKASEASPAEEIADLLQGGEMALADRWIVARLGEVAKESAAQLDAFDIGGAVRTLYAFAWDEFCDWYIEASKPALDGGNATTMRTLRAVLAQVLAMLHPVMPFVTSELYESLGFAKDGEQLAIAAWPETKSEYRDSEAVAAFSALRQTVSAARSLKNELGLAPQEKLTVAVEGEMRGVVLQNRRVVETIARVSLAEGGLEGRSLSQIESAVTVRAPLEGTVEVEDWLAKQQKRLAELDKQIKQAEGKLNNAGFVARAPEEVVEEERRRVSDFGAQKARLLEVLAQFT